VLDTAATIARIKQNAVRLKGSRSGVDRKRDATTIAPRRVIVNEFQSPKEQRRYYDSVPSPSNSWIGLDGVYSFSPSFEDRPTEAASTGFEVSETLLTPSKFRSKEASACFAGIGWFSDNIVSLSKVNDPGTEDSSHSTISELIGSTSFASN
jgi:hypothetical protein